MATAEPSDSTAAAAASATGMSATEIIAGYRQGITDRTQALHVITDRIESLLATDPQPSIANYIVTRVRDMMDEFGKETVLIMQQYEALISLDTKNTDGYKKKKREMRKTCSDNQSTFEKLLLPFIAIMPQASFAQGQAGSLVGALQTNRFSEDMKPNVLTENARPSEFTEWREAFTQYAEVSGMKSLPLKSQHAILRNLLSRALQGRMREPFLQQTSVFSQNGCLDILAQTFKEQNPLVTRRKEFFELRQKSSQDWSDFLSDKQRLLREGEFGNITQDMLLVHSVIAGTSDLQLKKRFLKLDDPGLADLEKACAILKSERIGTRDDTSSQETGRRTQVNNKNKNKNKNKNNGNKNQDSSQQGRGRSMNRSNHDGKKNRSVSFDNSTCFRCQRKGHLAANCKATPFCKICSVEGHSLRDCKNKQQGQNRKRSPSAGRSSKARRAMEGPPTDSQKEANRSAQSADQKADQSATPPAAQDNQRYVPGKETPLLTCTFKSHAGKTFRCAAVPDSGATKSIVDIKLLQRHGIPFVRNWNLTLNTVSGESMKVHGFVDLICETDHNQSCQVQALVAEGPVDEFLLSWSDLVALSYLPVDFPYPVQARPEHIDLCRALCSGTLPGCEPVLTHALQQAKQDILNSFPDVLCDSLDGSMMDCPPMQIHLRDDVPIQPFNLSTPRKVPLHMEDAAQRLVNELLETGIIERVDKPTEWCSPCQFILKPNGKDVRMVTDFTKLNQYVKRPVHPFRSAQSVLQSFRPESKYFAKVDLLSGYFQLPLAEQCRDLTCFITEYGRYRYCRGPMGLCATGDSFCQVTDSAIQGCQCIKIVDDIAVEAPTLAELVFKLKGVLQKLREHGLKCSKAKFSLGTSIPFAGSLVTSQGIRPDPQTLAAIQDFPTPQNLTHVRSFLGLANQLASYMPDLAPNTAHMRQLLRKDTQFSWTSTHNTEFEKVKLLLCSPPVVKPFDPQLPATLLTDASKLYGLGFALIQHEFDGTPRLIRCGSCSLTDTQSRYSTTELEALSIQYAIEKCDFFLRGCSHFTVITDHRPLYGIWKKRLDDIPNPRLMRIREKLASYVFSVEWSAGKTHLIADALSRFPVFSPSHFQAQCSEYDSVRLAQDMRQEPSLNNIFTCAKTDSEYKALLEALRTGKRPEDLSSSHLAKPFKNVWDQLTLLDDQYNTLVLVNDEQVVVPQSARSTLLQQLHISHAGVKKTKLAAKEKFFWPNMNKDIVHLCESCPVCIKHLPSKPTRPIQGGTPIKLLNPMDEVSVDLFYDRNQTYIVMADRYSGYFFFEKLKKEDTDHVTAQLTQWFYDHGWPKVIRSDNGPQFRDPFLKFANEHSISHITSSPYHHQSNGLAERAVRSAKQILDRSYDSRRDVRLVTQEYLSTPDTRTQVSPAALFFQRRPRGQVPHVDPPLDLKLAEEDRQLSLGPKKSCKPLFKVGDKVIAQNQQTKKWHLHGVIKEIRPGNLSYVVDLGDAGVKVRNQKFLRLDTISKSKIESKDVSTVIPPQPETPKAEVTTPPLRRSPRLLAKQS